MLVLLPFISPLSLFELTQMQILMLLFCCLNTLVRLRLFCRGVELLGCIESQRGPGASATVHNRFAEARGALPARLRLLRSLKSAVLARGFTASRGVRAYGSNAGISTVSSQ